MTERRRSEVPQASLGFRSEPAPYIVHEPDPPDLWILYSADGKRIGQYETREGAEAALVDYQWERPAEGKFV